MPGAERFRWLLKDCVAPGTPRHQVDAPAYDLVRGAGGTVSAEHGIGLVKKDFLAFTRSPEELALARQIRGLLDPRNVLNPGKVF